METVFLYWWKKCSSCRKVRTWLLNEGINFRARDFFEEPFSEVEIRNIVAEGSLREIFSFKSPSFRKIGANPDSLNEDMMLELMLIEPRLIRRPLIVIGKKVVIATNLDVIQETIKNGYYNQ